MAIHFVSGSISEKLRRCVVSEKSASGESNRLGAVRTQRPPISRPNASRPTASCSESSGSMLRRIPFAVPGYAFRSKHPRTSGRSSFHRADVSSRPTESSVKTHPPPPMFLRCCCWAPCLTTVWRPIIRPAGPLARVEAALRAANMVIFRVGQRYLLPFLTWLRAEYDGLSGCKVHASPVVAWSLLRPNSKAARPSTNK